MLTKMKWRAWSYRNVHLKVHGCTCTGRRSPERALGCRLHSWHVVPIGNQAVEVSVQRGEGVQTSFASGWNNEVNPNSAVQCERDLALSVTSLEPLAAKQLPILSNICRVDYALIIDETRHNLFEDDQCRLEGYDRCFRSVPKLD